MEALSSKKMELLMSMYDMEMIKRNSGIKFLLCLLMYEVISKMLLKYPYGARGHKKGQELVKRI